MSEEKKSIRDVIEGWHEANSQQFRGDGGTPYPRIPTNEMPAALVSLVKTMRDYGYTFEEIRQPRVAVEMAQQCLRLSKIKKLSRTKIIEMQEDLSKDFRFAIVSVQKDIKVVPREEIKITGIAVEEKKEKTIEEKLTKILGSENILPSKEIDRSNDVNWELLEELGIEPDETK